MEQAKSKNGSTKFTKRNGRVIGYAHHVEWIATLSDAVNASLLLSGDSR